VSGRLASAHRIISPKLRQSIFRGTPDLRERRPVGERFGGGYVPAMAELPAVVLGPPPEGFRTFSARREVRFADVDRHGRLRLDALAAYLQDVAGDDTADVGLRDTGGWVVRRNVFEVLRPPTYGQELTLTTWASGSGSRWAERRLTVTGPAGSRVEGVSLWVFVDPATLRPAPVDPRVAAVYAPAIGGRAVSSRLQHPTGPEPGAAVERWPWVVRATDIDPFGHVNNTATWAVVEEAAARGAWAPPYRAELEYRTPIPPDAAVVVEVQASAALTALWVRAAEGGPLFATARVRPLPG
jgi:acyl-ACP thioesterase